MRTKSVLAAAAAVTVLAAGAPAMATVVIQEGSCSSCSLDTVHLADSLVGDTFVNGTLASSSGTVLFSSNEPIGITGGPGQAWVGGTDGTTDNLTFQLNGQTFSALEFNLNTINGGGQPQVWGVTITGYDQNNVAFTQDFTGITNNQFFNVTAAPGSGEQISKVTLQIDSATNSSSPILAAGQFRVAAIGGAVPEPAAWAMMIVGLGGIGGLARRRRRLGHVTLA